MEARTEKEILTELITKGQETGILPDDENFLSELETGQYTQNQYVLILSTIAYILQQYDSRIVDLDNNTDLNVARGEYLDRMGELVNVHRVEAQNSYLQIHVSTPTPSENDMIIHEGTEVLLSNVVSNADLVTYTIDDDYVLQAGTSTTYVYATCDATGYIGRVPAMCVEGLDGYPNLNFSNPYPSTGGRDMEDDDSYRERIRTWASKNIKGTYACLVDYLDNYPGLDDYRLIPRWDGIGTLKIVCDCMETDLEDIKQGVQENCMLYTDDEVYVERPGEYVLSNLELVVHLDETISTNRSYEELAELINSQCHVFVNGGVDTNGNQVKRVGLGREFDPSKLISFILEQIPEVANLRSPNMQAPVHVEENTRIYLESVSINFE